jgi:hypothetical protein
MSLVTTTGSTTTPGATTTTTVQPPAGGFDRAGYFLQWGIYGRAYFPRDLVTPRPRTG